MFFKSSSRGRLIQEINSGNLKNPFTRRRAVRETAQSKKSSCTCKTHKAQSCIIDASKSTDAHWALQMSTTVLSLLLRGVIPLSQSFQRRHRASGHGRMNATHMRPPCVVTLVRNPSWHSQQQLEHCDLFLIDFLKILVLIENSKNGTHKKTKWRQKNGCCLFFTI